MAADRPARSGSFAPPPLVGREREQVTLRDRLAAARGGRGSLILIGGEAGIGKTALAESLCREATEQGALVLVGRCYDVSEAPPYGPWLELFARYRSADGDPPLPPVFAERGAVGAIADQAALFHQVRDFLIDLSAQRPLVLLFDDLHWTDPASLELLRVVARGLDSLPALVVATYRVEEVSGQHLLDQHLPAIVREASAERLSLQPLDGDAVRAFAARRFHLPEADQRRLVAYLQERGEGNPFFIGELLRTLEEAGALRKGEDGWVLNDLRNVRVPALVRQVIRGRLTRLDAEAQRLLAIAAVIGQEIPLALWATVAAENENTLLAVVEHAVEAHLLEERADGAHVRFVHALIRETLYEGASLSQRRLWHQRVAETLVARSAPDPDAVAYHFRQAGDERAVEWLIVAAERAQRAHAWLTAADRFETALILMEAHDADASERGWLLARLAYLRRYSETERGIECLEQAKHLADDAGDRVLAAYALVNRGWLRCLTGNTGLGVPELEAGVAAQGALSPADRARLNARRNALGSQSGDQADRIRLVLWNAAAGRYAVAAALADPLLRSQPAENSGDLYTAVANIHTMLGRATEARQAYAQAREAYAVSHYFGVGQCALLDLEWRVLPYHTNALAEREHIATEGEQFRARAMGLMKADESSRFVRLPLLLLEGNWADARQLAMDVRAVGRSMNYLRATTALCALAREQGEATLAWSLIQEILPRGPTTEPGAVWFMEAVSLQRVAIALALDEGDLPTAHGWLEMHDRWLGWSNAVLGRAEGELGWAMYHRAAADASLAYRHAANTLTLANEPRQPLALLATHRLLGELDTDAGRCTDAAARLEQALALADACAAPYERALTLLAYAALHAAMGNITDAQHALDETRAICTPLGAKPTLTRIDALAMALTAHVIPRPVYPDGLTAREIEVLRLLAQGRSNQEIAEALSMSARTAERHISNIYGKIHAHGRAEATAYAFQHELA